MNLISNFRIFNIIRFKTASKIGYQYGYQMVWVLALAALLYVGLGLDPRKVPSPLIDKPAPQFSLTRLKDPAATLGSTDLAGKVTLLNVWATWCVMCRQEHPFLMDLAASKAIPIYGINWRDNRPEAIRWLEALGDPYLASAYDADGRVGIDWGVYGAPETFLVDPEGTVIYKHLGPLNERIWQREFVARMNQLEVAE